jgi:hypothetical protein
MLWEASVIKPYVEELKEFPTQEVWPSALIQEIVTAP